MATLSAMQTSLRGLLGEDNPNGSWFTPTFLTDQLNGAMQELYNEMVEASVDFFTKTTAINLTVSTELYNLPADFYKVVLVERTDQVVPVPIRPIDITQRSRYLYSTVNPSSLVVGELRFYLQGVQIGLVPLPTDSTGVVTLHYVPTPVLMAGVNDTPPAGWPANHHEVIVWGAAKRCGVRDKDLFKLFDDNHKRLWEALKAHLNQRQTQEPRTIVDTDME